MSTTVSTPAEVFASAVAAHADRAGEHQAALAARAEAQASVQAIVDRVASGQPGSTGDLRRAEDAATEAGRAVTLAAAIATSAERQRNEAEITAAFAEADAMAEAYLAAVAKRAQAAKALNASVEAAQNALATWREAGHDVQFAHAAANRFNSRIESERVKGNPLMAALDTKPHADAPAPAAPKKIEVGLYSENMGELFRVARLPE